MTTESPRETQAGETKLFKNACRIHTDWMIDRYLMSNAVNRCDPAEKAQRHIELCQFYVAAVRGCSPEDAMSDYESDFDRLHEQSRELTSSLNTEIGFPLDQTPDYADLNPKFFERFHAIASRVLGINDWYTRASTSALEAENKALRDAVTQMIADLDRKRVERCTYCRKGYEWNAEHRQHVFHCASDKFDGQLLDCMAYELRQMVDQLRPALGEPR